MNKKKYRWTLFVSLLVLACIFTGTGIALAGAVSGANWWDTSWHYRTSVTVLNPNMPLYSSNYTSYSSERFSENNTSLSSDVVVSANVSGMNHTLDPYGDEVALSGVLSVNYTGGDWNLSVEGDYIGNMSYHSIPSDGEYSINASVIDGADRLVVNYTPNFTRYNNSSVPMLVVNGSELRYTRARMSHVLELIPEVQDRSAMLTINYMNCSGWIVSVDDNTLCSLPQHDDFDSEWYSIPGDWVKSKTRIRLGYDGSNSQDQCYVEFSRLRYTSNIARKDYVVSQNVNFTLALQDEGSYNVGFDVNSIRVVEYDSAGNVLDVTSSRFTEADDFDPGSNVAGEVKWVLDETTMPNAKRYYYVYFDIVENGVKPMDPGQMMVVQPEIKDTFDDSLRIDNISNATLEQGEVRLMKKTGKWIQCNLSDFNSSIRINVNLTDQGIVLGDNTTAGTFISPVYDAREIMEWGVILWHDIRPKGTDINISTRSSNNLLVWSEWSQCVNQQKVSSPNSRYLQYKVELYKNISIYADNNSASVTPMLRNVAIAHYKYMSLGYLISKPIDLPLTAGSVTLLWNGTVPKKTSLGVSVSSGDGWERVANGVPHKLNSHNGGTIRYKAELRSSSDVTPTLSDIQMEFHDKVLPRISLGDSDGIPTILSTSPQNGSSGVDIDTTLSMVFSKPMDKNSVERSLRVFSLQDDRSQEAPIPEFSWGAGDTEVQMGLEGLKYDTVYTAVSDKGTLGASGYGLIHPYSWYFITRGMTGGELAVSLWWLYLFMGAALVGLSIAMSINARRKRAAVLDTVFGRRL